MDNLGRLLFLHFEKMLAGLFSLALLYAVAFHGPWAYSTDYEGRLSEIAAKYSTLHVVTEADVPAVPPLFDEYVNAGELVGLTPLEDPYFWPINVSEGLDVLAPVGVSTEANRGWIALSYEINPNQPDQEGNLEFVGVEIERASVVADEPISFSSLTMSGDRPYLTATELYKIAAAVAPEVLGQQSERKRQRGGGPTEYTLDDLFNAVADGNLEPREMIRMVRDGVRAGTYSAEQALFVREVMRELGMSAREYQRELQDKLGRAPTPTELWKAMLRDAGYPGNSRYKPASTLPRPAAEAVVQVVKEVKVAFEDISVFLDTDVNPDSQYLYRLRFWAQDTTGEQADLSMCSEWAQTTVAASPKPDTEFTLTGGVVDGGKAYVEVKKWIPSTKTWSAKMYKVMPGEMIGGIENVNKTDDSGRVLSDAAGRPQTQEVDFSTQCVLLSFEKRPRALGSGETGTAFNSTGTEAFPVDNEGAVLYPKLRIIYSNRRGELRVKWQTSAEMG